MTVAKVFMSGQSQAVLLPEESRVAGNELAITKMGRSLVLSPIDPDWTDFFRILLEFDFDETIVRDQPLEQQERGPLAGA